MKIDALCIAGPNLFRPALQVTELDDAKRGLGLDGLVVAPGRPPDYHLPPANDALAEAMGKRSDLVRLARVDPNQGARAVHEVRRAVTQLGCRGVFLHPGEEVFVIRDAVHVVRAAADLGVPTVVASGLYALSEPLQVLDLAAAVPEAIVVMSTGGQINISGLSMVDAWRALEKHENLQVMTNGEYRQDFIERLARDLDPRRVLMATFAPYFDQAYEVARVASADLEPDARSLIEGKNAQRLFGLSPN